MYTNGNASEAHASRHVGKARCGASAIDNHLYLNTAFCCRAQRIRNASRQGIAGINVAFQVDRFLRLIDQHDQALKIGLGVVIEGFGGLMRRHIRPVVRGAE